MSSRRVTRQQTAATTATVQPSISISEPRGGGLFINDPVPRRSAPNRAASNLSISTNREGRSESDDDVDEVVVEDKEPSVEEEDAASSLGVDQDEQLDDMEARQLMISLLPTLRSTADDLMQRLKEGDYGQKVMRQITKTKRIHFYTVRDTYTVSKITTPFVDWSGQVDEDDQATEVNTLVRANLVSVLDGIRLLQADKKADALSFLRALDASYEKGLFGGNGKNLNLALRIRTTYFVEYLARQKGRVRPAEFIASVFCEKTKSTDFASILEKGPFRTLGGAGDAAWAKACSKRTGELLDVMSKSRKTYGVEALKEMYPPPELFNDLERWVLDDYARVRDLDSGEDVFHDAMQGAPGSQAASEADTQDVQRDPTAHRSMYTGPQSVLELNRPPSNQEQQAAASSAREMRPPPAPTQNGGSRGKTKRAAAAAAPPSDDDDDDVFETDSRPPNSAKRRRVAPPPTSSAPSPSALPAASQIEMDAVRARALATSSQARLQLRTELGQRTRWSTHDVHLLIDLVAKHRAAWSAIAKDDTARWDREEAKRGQQGLRDKARNLKVDFLLTDMPLPPCFDLVALSSKEVRRVEEARRNPFRREEDLDEDGRPTNTLL
ncbi:hypothetical protein JDV02_009983 [Purpureocillium takamizusanense]|uniref:Myb-like domain-containing protein n=1 Tax=Purpureocillium takamizusanense TaxID=2060973 RepID=A0A9Q8QTL4_9HYPO|nr:uncharacterized protein JDV02_009983 [Purpureocillium takamizusanense]UNI24217.1 hypothetical protein JDV02_009983 [Purpureocillium takamizusanense]